MSVTFGAGGSTLSHTPETVQRLRSEHGVAGVPHLTCVGGSREEIRSLLKLYRALGCDRIVALRGDMPSGMVAQRRPALRQRAGGTDPHRARRPLHHRSRGLSGNPSAGGRRAGRPAPLQAQGRRRRRCAITQYFYNADAYFRFVDDARALGIDIPIIPGIMPISNFSQLRRFSEACGAEIPRWIASACVAMATTPSASANSPPIWWRELCERLIAGGAPGLHFYTLNLAKPSLNVLAKLA
jgi:methylenetetrahydrofolate reductase (NADPH)